MKWLLLLALTACSDKGGLHARCTIDPDCRSPLICVLPYCRGPGSGTCEALTCHDNAECAPGSCYVTDGGGTCGPRQCQSSGDCARGTQCVSGYCLPTCDAGT